ncbi:MAG: hypothetical protein M1482_13365, partial [Chloroflexi bacterium]|nr:hypothetical protein [Chloroflexota bacterium]
CDLPTRRARFWRRFEIAALALILALLIFFAGVRVGEMKAWFSYRWAESYGTNFGGDPESGGQPRSIQRAVPPRFFNGHGVFNGEVISINGNRVLVKDRDGSEKTIVISGNTAIRRGPDELGLGDVHPDQLIIVVGTPDDSGRIDARLIRLFPTSGALWAPHRYLTHTEG